MAPSGTGGYSSPKRSNSRRFNDDPGAYVIETTGPKEKLPRPPARLTPEVVYGDVPQKDPSASPTRSPASGGNSANVAEPPEKCAAKQFLWPTVESVMLRPSEVASVGSLPLAAICAPFADGADSASLAVSDSGSDGPLRCPRCKSYANPHFRWSQRSHGKFQCNMCMHHLTVPDAMLEELDRAGQSADEEHHPELVFGSVDFTAPPGADVDRPTTPLVPAVIFLLEATAHAYLSGLFVSALTAIESLMDDPDSHLRRRVCLLTFDEKVRFYAPTRTSRFRCIVVNSLLDEESSESPFVPMGANLFFADVGTEEAQADFRDFLQLLRQQATDTISAGGVMPPRDCLAGTALRTSVEVLRKVGGGDVMVFHASSPSVGMGAPLEPKLPKGTKAPQHANFYQETLRLCIAGGVAVNVVTAASNAGEPLDLETLQWLCWGTGGDVQHIPGFEPGYTPQLREFLSHWSGKMQGSAYGCIVKFRCSKGLQCTGLLAPWPAALSSNDKSAFELPRISADTSFAFDLRVDVDVETEDLSYCRREDRRKSHYIQVAVLYTNIKGQRLLRLHTTSIGIATTVRAVYQSASIGPMLTYVAKQAAVVGLNYCSGGSSGSTGQNAKSSRSSLTHPRDYVLNFLLEVINKRLHLLPLYILGIRKLMYSMMNDGHDTGREFLKRLMRMPVHSILAAIYPRVYPLGLSPIALDGGDGSALPSPPQPLPSPIAPMLESVTKGSHVAYVICNGLGAWLYRDPSGAAAIEDGGDAEASTAASTAATAQAVCAQLREVLEPSPQVMPLMEFTNVGVGDKESQEQKVFIATLFIEDEGFTEMSYVDWVQYLAEKVVRMCE
eukprot:TRINITY_DN24201_c0_g1_i1.p1 TRINITY_DN24201_c0_g1~~TRINITY_DN24201_c0_g1_i1.p1  ORF type:complete len:873 (-),score=150.90 TRINITY_DN24201_c0_g1_i1:99-2618(-)